MVKLDKIYTRGGDSGQTSLGDGSRVDKHGARVAAYGTVDEANAVIGLARLHTEGEADAMLVRIQNDLFDLGADLCVPAAEGAKPRLRVSQTQVERLEADEAGVRLWAGGRGVEAQAAVVAVGVEPATALARSAGLALAIFFQANVEMNAIGPHVHVLLAFQTTFAPVAVFFFPVRFQPGHGGGTQSGRVRPQQRFQRLGEVSRADPLQVQPGNQLLNTLRLPQIGVFRK